MTRAFLSGMLGLMMVAPAALAADKPLTPTALAGGTLVEAAQLKAMRDSTKQLVIIDSRIASEFKQGHIAGSISIPQPQMASQKGKLPTSKTTPLAFYCNGPKCWKSYDAAKMALGWGFTKVYWLREGLPAWKKAHLPVVQGD
jgi:rhodanese-related sulfurtransferase